jgi:hypothetical protein
MRIRAALLFTAIAATIAAPLAATSHTVNAACHGTDRVLTPISQGGQTIYIDDRGYLDSPDTDPIYDTTGSDRLPALGTDGDAGGYWIYYESNQHEGLQTGGDHLVLGETGEAIGETDPCRATHNVGGASVGFDAIIF